VRDAWPDELPVLVRISATDWKEGGWDLEQSIAFARELKEIGVDMIDVSSGGNAADQKVVLDPVPGALRRGHPPRRRHSRGAGRPHHEPVQAEHILATGQADAVCLARALLRDPYWPRHAAAALGEPMAWPNPVQALARPPGWAADPETAMIDLYYWATPNGHKITMYLEEAKLPYRLHGINISKGGSSPPTS